MNFKVGIATLALALVTLACNPSTVKAQGPGIFDGNGIFDGGGIIDRTPNAGVIDGGGVFDGGGIFDARYDNRYVGYNNGYTGNATTNYYGTTNNGYVPTTYSTASVPTTYTVNSVRPVGLYSSTVNPCCCQAQTARRGLFGRLRY